MNINNHDMVNGGQQTCVSDDRALVVVVEIDLGEFAESSVIDQNIWESSRESGRVSQQKSLHSSRKNTNRLFEEENSQNYGQTCLGIKYSPNHKLHLKGR